MTSGALQIEGMSKSFGGVKALDDASLEVGAGEVHGLLGQNGSGKSTLVKCISGVQSPDSGSVRIWGKELSFPLTSPARLGIATIHQDLGLVDSLSVLDNLSVGASFGTRILRPISVKKETAIYETLKDQLHIRLDLRAPVASLSSPERTFVGVLRAMRLLAEHTEKQLFILDEPTTALAAADALLVTDFMRRVAAGGAAVVFISHHLGEVLSVCDAVTVLRDGKVVTSQVVGSLSKDDVIERMLGRRMESYYPSKAPCPSKEVALRVRDLSGHKVDGISFDVAAGEVVGVTGLTGMGQDELPYLLTGAVSPTKGEVALAGGDLLGQGSAESIAAGVALIPGNRQRDGVWLEGTAGENITLPRLRQFRSLAGLSSSGESTSSEQLMGQLMVRPPNARMRIANFSGGNQQKIVLAKWLQMQPRLLLLDEPTQGVDAGAKREILQLALEVAKRGGAVIVFSGDHEQLAAICHRVIIMRDGSISSEMRGDDLSEVRLLAASNL